MGAMRRARAPAGAFAPKSKSPSGDARHDFGPEALDRLHQHVMPHEAVVGVAEHPFDRQPAAQLFERAGDRVDRADQRITLLNRFLRASWRQAGVGIDHTLAKAERLEPGAAGEHAGIAPQGDRLGIAIGDDDVAQNAHAVAAPAPRHLGIDVVKIVLIAGVHRRQDRRDALLWRTSGCYARSWRRAGRSADAAAAAALARLQLISAPRSRRRRPISMSYRASTVSLRPGSASICPDSSAAARSTPF